MGSSIGSTPAKAIASSRICGSRSMIFSRPRWRRSSRTDPLIPRPSRISVASDRDTTSREASSSLLGAYLLMKRSPSEFRR
jgi:hypothetical protein